MTPKHWRRYHSSPDGFMLHCKECTVKSIKNHYRKWYMRDVLERGQVGVKCLLWSEYCGVCPCPSETELEQCWRLEDSGPEYEDYPVTLGE